MENQKILILYTGGTIGMTHKNSDGESPLVPAGQGYDVRDVKTKMTEDLRGEISG